MDLMSYDLISTSQSPEGTSL